MRNLKRMLSLVMAAAMLMSMMVVSAGASYEDFTDSDEIVNTEAVNAMVNLNVINGYDTGDFQPETLVTRAQMAKMIAVALNGGEDIASGYTCDYTDVATTDWAYKYIAYCTAKGIVAGDGTGAFNPEAYVTGVEAAKMMLVAMGYDADTEGYVGSNWDNNVQARADETGIKLFAGNSIDRNLSMSRDYAALLIYNGINAQQIFYNASTGAVQTMGTMLANCFDVVLVEGYVVGNEYASLLSSTSAMGEDETYVKIVSVDGDTTYNVTGMVVGSSYTFEASTGADVLGRAVSFYTTTDKVVIGSVTLSGTDAVYTTTTTASRYGLDEDLTDEGLALTYYVDGTSVATPVHLNYAANSVDTSFTGRSAYEYFMDNGYTATFIDQDDDGKVDLVIFVQPVFVEVTIYSTTSETLTLKDLVTGYTSNYSGLDFEEVDGYEDFAKGDYAMVTLVDGIYYLEVVETVTATITSIATSTEKLTAGGTTYEASAMADTNTVDFSVTDNLGYEVTLYLDASGYVVMVDGDAVATDEYLVLTKATEVTDDWGVFSAVKANAVFYDGTTAVIEVTDVTDTTTELDSYLLVASDSNDNTSATASGAAVFNYSVDSDGYYSLTEVSAVPIDTLTTGTATVESSYYALSTTIFVVYNGGSVSLYEGIANAPTAATTTSTITAMAGAYDATNCLDIVFINGSASSSSTGDYAYIVDDYYAGLNDDGVVEYYYTAIVGGEVVELAVNKDTTGVGSLVGLYALTYTNGVVSGVDATNDPCIVASVSMTDETNQSYFARNGVICGYDTVNSTADVWTYDDDTVFVVVDGANYYTSDEGDIICNEGSSYDSTLYMILDDSTGTYVTYVYIVQA